MFLLAGGQRAMICPCNFEELQALAAGAEAILATQRGPQPLIQDLLDQLDGDLVLGSLAAQARTLSGVSAVVQHLRTGLDEAILETHPAEEGAVQAYFNYAHALSVQHRLEVLGEEQRALEALLHEEDVSLFP
jgi:hypothetical protein